MNRMFKKKLFNEESDDEIEIKTQNEYAKKYDSWREKEELHKLEQKYGAKALSSDASASSDSEDESDEPPVVSEETEAQFLKTLALLKTKDPRIYDPQFKFFEEKEEEHKEDEPKPRTLTFEDSDDDDDDDNDGNIFTIEKKAEIISDKAVDKQSGSSKKKSKGGKLKEYLTGKVDHIEDEVEQDLAPLKALWSDPKLNEGEAFLRDYILNKKYLEGVDAGTAEDRLRDDEELEEDEKRVEEQGKFERAYNFRFEEPDEEYLKRYPRTMNYIRPKDERRARARAELRTRKEEEKRRKMEEIARMKALKLKEIQEKIARIKEVTGNQDLAFKDEDIEGDFDPVEHDRRMKALFDEQYYGDVDEEKPVFPDLDEELEIENWDNYCPEHEQNNSHEDGPHCEDEDFNMDADYDPKQARAHLLDHIKENLGKKPRNRKKKSKLAALLATEKPKYVPTVVDKTYSEYMEEYYKMDCEDVIGGDLPTRFKYREVVPNDFGLSIEEILLADDKELTQWVPLKKIVKHRPADVEKGEVKTYQQKAADIRLKRKILPSLFKELPEEPEIAVPVEEATKKNKKKKKNKAKGASQSIDNSEDNELSSDKKDGNPEEYDENLETVTKKKKKHEKITNNNDGVKETNVEIPKKKKKHKELNPNYETSNTDIIKNNKMLDETVNEEQDVEAKKNIKKKKKHKSDGFIVENIIAEAPSQENHRNLEFKKGNNTENTVTKHKKRKLETNNDQVLNKKKKYKTSKNDKSNKNKTKFIHKSNVNKQNQDKSSDNPLSKLSDERLKAYGLNPKKYRSFLKYKKY